MNYEPCYPGTAVSTVISETHYAKITCFNMISEACYQDATSMMLSESSCRKETHFLRWFMQPVCRNNHSCLPWFSKPATQKKKNVFFDDFQTLLTRNIVVRYNSFCCDLQKQLSRNTSLKDGFGSPLSWSNISYDDFWTLLSRSSIAYGTFWNQLSNNNSCLHCFLHHAKPEQLFLVGFLKTAAKTHQRFWMTWFLNPNIQKQNLNHMICDPRCPETKRFTLISATSYPGALCFTMISETSYQTSSPFMMISKSSYPKNNNVYFDFWTPLATKTTF